MSEMFCGTCGTALSAGSSFCPSCGRPVTRQGPDLELRDHLFDEPREATRFAQEQAVKVEPVALPLSPAPAYEPRLPGVGITVLVTFFLGLIGLIPATIHSNRAARMGMPTNRYRKAFGWTLAAGALIGVALYASLFLGVFRAVDSSSTAGDVSSSTEGLAGTVPDSSPQSSGDLGSALPSAPAEDGAVDSTNTPIVLPNIAQICAESSGVGPHAASAAGNAKTSCPFAEAVRSAYDTSGANGTTVSVDAFSPVTEKWYTVQCGGEAPVTCTGTGGFDILIFIYPSDAEVVRSG